MVDVLFVRVPIQAAAAVSVILQNLYRAGWRVVSHSESGGEYSFVLEGYTSESGFVIGYKTAQLPPAGVVPTGYTTILPTNG